MTDPSDSEEKYASNRVLHKGAAASHAIAIPDVVIDNIADPTIPPVAASPTTGKRKAENSGVDHDRPGKRQK